MGGKLKLPSSLPQWEQQRSRFPNIVPSVIEGLTLPFTARPPLTSSPTILSPSSAAVIQLIKELQSKSIIKKLHPKEIQVPGHYARVFAIPKANKKEHRFLIDLRKLNEHIHTPHVKFERLKDLTAMIHKNDYLTSIDLKDAYYHVPLHPSYQKYLRFAIQLPQGEVEVFQFLAMPMGLSIAPAVFTKVMRVPLTQLREEGIRMTAYLDDLLIVAKSPDQARIHTQRVIEVMEMYGFTINKKKSELIPTREIKFLGMLLNTNHQNITVPNDKLRQVRQSVQQALKRRNQKIRIRMIARVIGQLVALSPAIDNTRVHLAYLHRDKAQAVKDRGWDGEMELSEEAIRELQFWDKNLSLMSRTGRSWSMIKPSLQLNTDASNLGWGAILKTLQDQPIAYVNGHWKQDLQDLHINHKELIAVLNALQEFYQHLHNQVVRLNTDNEVVMWYINKKGGRIPELCEIMKEILKLCNQHHIILMAVHIQGELNVEADQLSRDQAKVHNNYSEAMLHPNIMEKIINQVGDITIDLFADRYTRQALHFVSLSPDPTAIAIDAFTLDWSKYHLPLVHPPLILWPRVLHKIRHDKATVVAILPMWTSAIWWPEAKAMLKKVLFTVPRSTPYLLPHPNLTHLPLDPPPWKLIVGILSSSGCKERMIPL